MELVPHSGKTSNTAPIERRSFLRGRFKKPKETVKIRPPWTDEARIAEACTACGDCVRACPEGIIVRSENATPEVDFSAGECSFCGACADACQEPVFWERQALPWELSLAITETCLVKKGVYCRSCGDACAERAITFQPKIGGEAEIEFVQSNCTGCGACVSTCPVNATSLSPTTLIQGGGVG
ncbi:ferredoxin-type protein NapF [Pelagibius sp. Alg239-R121]|uniref:ferredoxin-type protein NapF n=1 Tax=Pelagibius sp. Alg239-R121 TaxID=2993448 RepID=UPI0024A75397|nr:ferredoxin-type protein NapF [Pelagibius sp. Alg239-R121]